MTPENTDTPLKADCPSAPCSASFPAMPLDAALEFADNGGSTGGIMTHEALKALAKSVREISTAAREVAAHLADELKIKPTANRYMAERAMERLNNSLPNAESCHGRDNKPKGTQAKIELLYNGDYPGYQCVRVNDEWLTTAEAALLCKVFKTNNLRELYDKVGLSKNWDGIPSEEHKPFTGVIAISQ